MLNEISTEICFLTKTLIIYCKSNVNEAIYSFYSLSKISFDFSNTSACWKVTSYLIIWIENLEVFAVICIHLINFWGNVCHVILWRTSHYYFANIWEWKQINFQVDQK
jgi:hypothetical protein